MIKIGSINIPDAIVTTEWRLMVLERLVQELAQRSAIAPQLADMVASFRKESLEELRKKYPDAGLELKTSEVTPAA
jgi:hypothetical protein